MTFIPATQAIATRGTIYGALLRACVSQEVSHTSGTARPGGSKPAGSGTSTPKGKPPATTSRHPEEDEEGNIVAVRNGRITTFRKDGTITRAQQGRDSSKVSEGAEKEGFAVGVP